MSGAGIRRIAAIDYRCAAYDWPFARAEAARIDAHWTQAVAEKPGLFDGRVFVAHDVTIEDDVLRARAFEASYKTFLAWRDFGFPGEPVVNLFSMCALSAADGTFMLGEMGPGTASAGRLYFPAGTPEPADAQAGIVDLEGNMRRELEEETGLTPAEITLEPGWTLVADEARLACMRRGWSTLSAEAMITRFERFRLTQTEPELTALHPVRGPDDIDDARMPGFMTIYLRAMFAAAEAV